ncbi:MAG: hypothetical protein ACO3PR_10110, partial [Limisphaerales bacterium]
MNPTPSSQPDKVQPSFANQEQHHSRESIGDQQGEYWRYCARCGHELHNHKCKLICPQCGYFMSCS